MGPYMARMTLKPDAYVKLAVGAYVYSWLLELDMATEALTTIERKARRHLDYHRSGEARGTHGVSPRVLWIAPDEERATAIGRALDRLPTEAARLFAITTANTATALLMNGVRS